MRAKAQKLSADASDALTRLADAYRVAPTQEAVAKAIGKRTLHRSPLSRLFQGKSESAALVGLVRYIADNPGTTLDRLERDDPLSNDVVSQMDIVVAAAFATNPTRTMSDRNLVECVLSNVRDAFWREKAGLK